MSKSSILDSFCRKCRLGLIAMAASAIMSGCASSPAHRIGLSELSGPVPPVTITVDNRRLTDISVYAVVRDTRVRLGAVEPMASKAFTLPRVVPIPCDIEMFATARVDDENYSSLPIALRPGDSILFIVENAMKFSMLLRR